MSETLPKVCPSVMYIITGLDVGGAEKQLLLLASERQKKGIEVIIVSLKKGGVLRPEFESQGIKVYDLGMKRGIPNPFPLFRLIYLINKFKPKIIHSWMYHADLLATIALRMSFQRKATSLIWGVRCSDMDLTRYSFLLNCVVWCCVRLSKTPELITYNSHAGARVHHSLGYYSGRSKIIGNGVDIQLFKPDAHLREKNRQELNIPEGVFVIANVARVDPMKDHKNLLLALDKLPDITAVFIGDGTEKLSDHKRCYGLGRRSDISKLLPVADLIVSSSAFGEGCSNALIEGMACGLPAVATDTGDAAYLLGEAGKVVKVRDTEALAAAIQEFAEMEESEINDYKLAARERIIKLFSLESLVENYEQLYSSLL